MTKGRGTHNGARGNVFPGEPKVSSPSATCNNEERIMSWPNSVAMPNPSPVRRTVPVPANDNWRMPRTNFRPPRPSNDNFPSRSRGVKLPGVLRRLPGLLGIALGVGTVLTSYYMRDEGEELVLGPNWVWIGDKCSPELPVTNLASTSGTLSCAHQLYQMPLEKNILLRQPNRVNMWASNQDYSNVDDNGNPWTTRVGFLARTGGQQPIPYFRAIRSVAALPRPIDVRTSVRPGRYIAPTQILPEWPSAGYHHPNQPRPAQERYLKSEPPARGTRERKVRLKDYRIGRTIEWLVAQATEGLDFQRALFEALPWWRKIALYKAARRLELRYNQDRIIAGRLHYVDLTPAEKMQAIYDYIDEIDVARAVENVIKMQLTDMFWAEIGRRMGRYQIGPWDDHGYNGPEAEAEWQDYIPDTAPDTVHNHWTYETLVNRRLTRQEAERIHRQYDQYRSQLYEG